MRPNGPTVGGPATTGSPAPSRPSRDAAFERVYLQLRDDIWRYCARRVPNGEVNDAVADVFVVVWRRHDELPAAGDARLWVFGIARNVIRNRQRSGRRRRRLGGRIGALPHASAPGADELAARRSEHRDLHDAVDRLPEDDRELLRLRTWEELSLADIAAVTGLSVRAVESRLGRVRKKLAGALDDTAGTVRRTVARSGTVQLATNESELWSSPTPDEGGER